MHLEMPFKGKNMNSISYSILNDKPKMKKEYSNHLINLVMSLLNKNSELRLTINEINN